MMIITIAILASCHAAPETPSPPPSQVDRSFLTGQPCAAPCWYGLQLGESITEEEIVSTLKTLPFVEPGSIDRTMDIRLFPDGRSVEFKCPASKRTICGAAILSGGKLKVLETPMQYALTFKTVVERLGPPDSVDYGPMNPEKPGCALKLVWTKQGIRADHLDAGSERTCNLLRDGRGLDGSREVIGLTYYSPDALRLVSAHKLGVQVAWPGFTQ